MFEKEKLTLSDLIDIQFLQEFQDIFANSMGLASLTIDSSGPVTKPSNFTRFCMKYARGTIEGASKCNACDIKWGRMVAETGEPTIYCCHNGLTDFAVPIMVEGNHLATILGGQVFTKELTDEECQLLLAQVGVDSPEALQYLKEIAVIPLEKVKSAAYLLHKVANAISEIGHKNLKLIKKNKREQLYREIMKTIRCSLDIDETKKQIVDIIGKTFNADRCYLVEYEKEFDRFKPIKDEYLSADSVSSTIGTDVDVEIPYLANVARIGQIIVFHSNEFSLDIQDPDLLQTMKSVKKYGVKSAVGLPLFHNGEIVGGLSIQHVLKDHDISEEDIELLKMVAEQISIGLYQAKLYNLTRIQAEREKINRQAVEVLSSTLDKTKIKTLFVNSVGEYFNADRVLFCEYDKLNKKFMPADEISEYLSDKNEFSFVGYEWTKDSLSDFVQPLINREEVNIVNWEEYVETSEKRCGFVEEFMEANIKSTYNIPVVYKDNLLGFFALDFTREAKELSDDDMAFLRNIAHQMANGLFHSNLYISVEEASRKKGEFIANMSHEIKTPLNIIIGFSEVLSEVEFERSRQVEYLNNIKNSGKHLLNLTNDIIDISKIEAGNLKLEYSLIDSEALIRGLVKSMQLIVSNKNINVELNLEKVFINADNKMLTQILYNLLNNAIKFTRDGGNIKITSELQNGNLAVSVQDDGIGIDPEHHGIIFDIFKQVDSSLAKRHQGAGLGLAITKKLIELHQGSIYVDSAKDCGSKFWFVIPGALNNCPVSQ